MQRPQFYIALKKFEIIYFSGACQGNFIDTFLHQVGNKSVTDKTKGESNLEENLRDFF